MTFENSHTFTLFGIEFKKQFVDADCQTLSLAATIAMLLPHAKSVDGSRRLSASILFGALFGDSSMVATARKATMKALRASLATQVGAAKLDGLGVIIDPATGKQGKKNKAHAEYFIPHEDSPEQADMAVSYFASRHRHTQTATATSMAGVRGLVKSKVLPEGTTPAKLAVADRRAKALEAAA